MYSVASVCVFVRVQSNLVSKVYQNKFIDFCKIYSRHFLHDTPKVINLWRRWVD